MLGMCVPWLGVARYVCTNVCSGLLQVVSGRVLCGGSMCICGPVSEGVYYNKIVHTLMSWLVSNFNEGNLLIVQ